MLLRGVVANCPHCGEPNEIEVDRTAGDRQKFIEDCWVCCRPISYSVSIKADGEISLHAEKAY